MNNLIELYQQDTQTIAVYVGGISDLTLYDSWLTVKNKTTDTSSYLQKSGVVSDPSTTIVFNLTGVDTSLKAGDYVYDIVLESSTLGYHTIVKDRFSVLDGVRH